MSGTANIFHWNAHTFKDILPIVAFLLFFLTPIGYKVMDNTDLLQYFCVCVLFQMPKMQFRSNAKPSLYAYPEPLKPPKKEEKEKV